MDHLHSDSPFIAGARVAIKSRYGDGYREGFVEKVYKSSRFTLRGSKQQWRPESPGRYDDGVWTAFETGGGISTGSLKIWNAATDAEISALIAKNDRRARFRALREKMDHLRADDITEEFLAAVEAALKADASEVAR